MTKTLATTSRTTLRRRRQRGSFDRAAIERILDEGLVCHVGFTGTSGPVVLPTAYARIDDQLYLHGAVANGMLGALADRIPLCVAFTLLDGLVFARSAFHHTMNYRSVVLFGTADNVFDREEKRRALTALVEQVARGRSKETRPPSGAELDQTRVLRIPIREASAKIRSGPPVDDEADLALPYWAGEVPLSTEPGQPISAPASTSVTEPPPSVRALSPAAAPTYRTVQRGEITISADPNRLDFEMIHRYLATRSYWSEGVAPELQRIANENALCIGVYLNDRQIGFARVVTDRAFLAYLCDVFVLDEFQRSGIGSALLEFIHTLPDLKRVRRWILATRDAHAFYESLGWKRVGARTDLMERRTSEA